MRQQGQWTSLKGQAPQGERMHTSVHGTHLFKVAVDHGHKPLGGNEGK